jgi:glutaredoxin-related protein
MPVDINGRQNKARVYKKCRNANICLFLEDGKLAQCGFPFLMRHFADYFNLSMKIHKNDYVDIFKIKDLKKVFKKFSKPIPSCRYCKAVRIAEPWDVSKRQLEEWI